MPNIPTSLPKVHKIDIQQGNEISSEMLMNLKPGMTKPQARFVLGTPLIQDTFHQERWDYVYEMRVRDIVIERRHVVLNFEDEKLKTITGEVIPKSDDVKLNEELDKTDKNLQINDKKGNNELEISVKEEKSSQPVKLPPLIEDTEVLIEDTEVSSDKEPPIFVDTSESINEAIKKDIIDSLPEKDDPGYFDLLLEKIGF
jgi:outer membrane protein assembly factor BamE|tara:strand:- start:1 stop:600 length:600 start_codon:yes stop_codon:yes gene_type:complete